MECQSSGDESRPTGCETVYFIVKRYTSAIKPNVSTDELFASDTPRESCVIVGHSDAGTALLNLTTLLHLTSKDDYQGQLIQACKNLLENAMKVFSDGRTNFTDLANMETVLETLLTDNTILTRDAMRQFLAPIVYDQRFEDLRIEKHHPTVDSFDGSSL